mmetsp:Transcript_23306/g.56251  ORF Transcript_23306/g.56251 Transcript_23306/m.56251 type:complete len:257 (-) Transcript_23306:1645-2415(-)
MVQGDVQGIRGGGKVGEGAAAAGTHGRGTIGGGTRRAVRRRVPCARRMRRESPPAMQRCSQEVRSLLQFDTLLAEDGGHVLPRVGQRRRLDPTRGIRRGQRPLPREGTRRGVHLRHQVRSRAIRPGRRDVSQAHRELRRRPRAQGRAGRYGIPRRIRSRLRAHVGQFVDGERDAPRRGVGGVGAGTRWHDDAIESQAEDGARGANAGRRYGDVAAVRGEWRQEGGDDDGRPRGLRGRVCGVVEAGCPEWEGRAAAG